MAQTDFVATGAVGVNLYAVDSDVPTQKVLTIVKGLSPNYGAGTFIYLKGVASTAEGSVVTYDEVGVTTLLASGAIAPVAVALGATVANTWGWYQIEGKACCKVAASSAADAKVGYEGASATIGDGYTDGDMIFNAVSRSATDTPATGFCWVQFSGRPFVNAETDAIA